MIEYLEEFLLPFNNAYKIRPFIGIIVGFSVRGLTMPRISRNFFALLLGVLGLILLFAVACGPTDPDETVPTEEIQTTPLTSSTEAAYPISTPIVAEYPAPVYDAQAANESGYPAPAEPGPRVDPSERFQFDLPLAANSTIVSGNAAKNLPLAIVDVTFAGVILGSGQSDENGRFEIPVTPLPEGHRIGIALASLEPDVEFQDKLTELYPYRGDGYMMLPDIGVFFDTAMTEE